MLFILIMIILLLIIITVCGKMNTLSTCDSNDDKIAAFISVLACSKDEAVFFLDSAAWSVEEVCIYIYVHASSSICGYVCSYTCLYTCIWTYILFRYVYISVIYLWVYLWEYFLDSAAWSIQEVNTCFCVWIFRYMYMFIHTYVCMYVCMII
jgi:hypothetical protein